MKRRKARLRCILLSASVNLEGDEVQGGHFASSLSVHIFLTASSFLICLSFVRLRILCIGKRSNHLDNRPCATYTRFHAISHGRKATCHPPTPFQGFQLLGHISKPTWLQNARPSRGPRTVQHARPGKFGRREQVRTELGKEIIVIHTSHYWRF